MSEKDKKTIVILGAGPAGLTAAYELLKHPINYQIIILEKNSCVGGLAKTVEYNGNRMDIGGHRFFSNVQRVNKWWDEILPYNESLDSLIYPSAIDDAVQNQNVMLLRRRISRIYYKGKFYDYPIKLNLDTLSNLGFLTSEKILLSYLSARIFPRKENSLEDFYINHFGKQLYSLFFEYYTENVWGKHPASLDPSWGHQRIKGVSISEVIRNAIINKVFPGKTPTQTSFIEYFHYPMYGPGQMWDEVASRIRKMGGKIFLNSEVIHINKNVDNKINAIAYKCNADSLPHKINADIVLSSIPLKDLVFHMNAVPAEISNIALHLPYRDYITVGILVRRLALTNRTNIKTPGNIVPDDWIYIQDRITKVARIQIYNNWSPYLVLDPYHTVWIGMEYYCTEGDSFWNQSDAALINYAGQELVETGIIESSTMIMDAHVEKIEKAYPAYYGSYKYINNLKNWLNSIPNLICIGRNGQHHYDNMDRAMCTAFEAVKDIRTKNVDHTHVWNC